MLRFIKNLVKDKKGDFSVQKLMGILLVLALLIFFIFFSKGIRGKIVTSFETFFDFLR
jgi:hypothetical protein